MIVGRIANEEEEISMLFQLVSSLTETGEKDVAAHAPVIVSRLIQSPSTYHPIKSHGLKYAQFTLILCIVFLLLLSLCGHLINAGFEMI